MAPKAPDAPESPTRYAAYSPNESAINSGAGFWSNQEGWTDQEHATSFSLDEARTLNLPLSVGQDAQWVPFPDQPFSSQPTKEKS